MRILLVSLVSGLLLFPFETAWAHYGKRLCKNVNVPCVVVQRGDSWRSLWSDPDDRDMAMRVNRTNSRLRPGMRLVMPDRMSQAHIWSTLPFPRHIGQQNQRTIIINLGKMAWAAYDADGSFVKWGPTAAGKNYCPDVKRKCNTPRGTFTIYRKGGAGCASKKYPLPNGGAPMPYCMFFKGGYALHGGQLPGYNASHGCVRVLHQDARWLSQNFTHTGKTKVIIK